MPDHKAVQTKDLRNGAVAKRRIKTIREKLQEPSMMLLLALQLLLIFIFCPLLSLGKNLPIGLFVAVYVCGTLLVVVASRHRMAMVVVIAAVCFSVVAIMIRTESETAVTNSLSAFSAVLSLGGLSWVVARAVFSPGRISVYRVMGAVVLYLNCAIVFVTMYRLVAEIVPGSFANIPVVFDPVKSLGELMYFSMSTLTTVGYGDIVPINPFARSLSNFEALVGQLYPAIVLARIVTLYEAKK